MGSYLTNIAARSSAMETNAFLPNRPEKFASDSGNIDVIDHEDSFRDSLNQPQFVQENIQSAQPNLMPKAQQPFDLYNQDINEQKQQMEAGYFSKHIERGEVENITPVNNAGKTIRYEVENPIQTKVTNHIEAKINTDNPVFVKTSVQKILPETEESIKQTGLNQEHENKEVIQKGEKRLLQKKLILPIFDIADEAIKNEKQSNRKVERINPIQPEQVSAPKDQRNRSSQPTKKLVIGKIIVEMLPPVQPLPQKVITRTIPTALKNNQPKPSKLMFGLGQL